MESAIIDLAGKWGLGIVLSIIIIFMFRKHLSRTQDAMSEERAVYKDFIEKQSHTIDNGIGGLSNSIDRLSGKIADSNVLLARQQETINQGLSKVVEVIGIYKNVSEEKNKLEE